MASRPSGWQVIPGGKAWRPRPNAVPQSSPRRKAQAVHRRLGGLAIAALVVATGCIAISFFSPWPFLETMKHIYAARNCAAARAVGLAPARRDAPGYWPRHDADNDGIACEPWPHTQGHTINRQ